LSAQTVWIIGAGGRIGGLLAGMVQGPWAPVGLRRGDVGAALGAPGPAAPIVVCARNDDLDAVLAEVHPSRHLDLVFLQNGMFQPALAQRGLLEATQGVLYVAVTHPGADPVPGGPSALWGRWADTLAGMMQAHGVEAQAVNRPSLQREIAVKLAWICCFGLWGEREQTTVGALLDGHRAGLRALCDELHPLLVAALGLDLDAPALWGRVEAYGERVRHFPARLKERRWRNGWVVAEGQARAIPTPLHDRLLAEIDARGA
jgi:ketopantoate reductase